MKTAKAILTLLLLIDLAGCGMGWTRPNTSEAQFNQDRYQCEKEAVSMYPPVRPKPQSSQTDCTAYGNQMTCTTSPTYSGTQPDTNQTARTHAVSSCLEARGYAWRWSRE